MGDRQTDRQTDRERGGREREREREGGRERERERERERGEGGTQTHKTQYSTLHTDKNHAGVFYSSGGNILPSPALFLHTDDPRISKTSRPALTPRSARAQTELRRVRPWHQSARKTPFAWWRVEEDRCQALATSPMDGQIRQRVCANERAHRELHARLASLLPL